MIIKYENVIAIAIHTLNVAELPFEGQAVMLKRYCEFLEKATDLLMGEPGCREVLVYDYFLCGILEGGSRETLERAVKIAGEVDRLLFEWNTISEENVKLFCGIGVDLGMAVSHKMNRGYPGNLWIGPVFGHAHAMAKMACLDGKNRVMMSEGVCNALYSCPIM